jgi:hypothetical protein
MTRVQTGGPVPKRSTTRRRRNKESVPTKIGRYTTGIPFEANEDWTPSVQALWNSLGDSPMSQYFEDTDWAFAAVTFDVLSEALTIRNNTTGQLNATMINSCMVGLSRLGITEADRRRLKVEIEKPGTPAEDDATITVLDSYRERLGA